MVTGACLRWAEHQLPAHLGRTYPWKHNTRTVALGGSDSGQQRSVVPSRGSGYRLQ